MSVARDAARSLGALDRQPIHMVHGSEMRSRPKPPSLVEGMLPLEGIGAMVGPSGAYKSFLLLDLMLCIGTGRPFLGHQVPQAGWCVYVLGEGQADAGERLDAALSVKRGYTDQRIAYIEQAFPLADATAVAEVIALCGQLAAWSKVPVRLVGLDSLADFYGESYNENSASDTQQIVAGMKRVSAGVSCAVLANAHTGHGGTDADGIPLPPPERMRGSSRWRQAFDFEWMANGSRLVCTKNRYGPKFHPVPYAVVPQGTSLVIAAPGITAQAAAPAEPEWPHPATMEQVEQVVAAVKQTPGMSMTAVARVVKARKDTTGIALLKAAEMGLAANAGTKSSPKWVPGPMQKAIESFMEWYASRADSAGLGEDGSGEPAAPPLVSRT